MSSSLPAPFGVMRAEMLKHWETFLRAGNFYKQSSDTDSSLSCPHTLGSKPPGILKVAYKLALVPSKPNEILKMLKIRRSRRNAHSHNFLEDLHWLIQNVYSPIPKGESRRVFLDDTKKAWSKRTKRYCVLIGCPYSEHLEEEKKLVKTKDLNWFFISRKTKMKISVMKWSQTTT